MNKKEELTAEQIAELKAAYDAIDRRAHFGGIFGIESAANEDARRVKLEKIKEGIEQHDRGYEGAYRKCPTCGGKQKYKGAATKELEFDCGKLTIQRAYYHCAKCKSTSFPLDEKLGLVEGQEQGILREKLCMLAILSPYNQASQVCKTLLGSESYAMNLSRIVNRESSRFESRRGLRVGKMTKSYAIAGREIEYISRLMGTCAQREKSGEMRMIMDIARQK